MDDGFDRRFGWSSVHRAGTFQCPTARSAVVRIGFTRRRTTLSTGEQAGFKLDDVAVTTLTLAGRPRCVLSCEDRACSACLTHWVAKDVPVAPCAPVRPWPDWNERTSVSTAQTAGDELLRAERLKKLYPDGDVRALDGVDLVIRRGEFVAIVGPSGSGKSTLLQLLGMLDEPTEGEVYFAGQPVSQLVNTDRLRAEQIGFVFQSFHLLPMLTALENVQVPMFESARPHAAREMHAMRLLAEVGMQHRAQHLPLRLSVGERQRIAIARALANDPALLLADEPTGNLDTRTGEEILELFLRLHRQENLTVVLITHDPRVAERAARVISLRDGKIEADERR